MASPCIGRPIKIIRTGIKYVCRPSLGLRKAGSSVGRCKAGQASTLILRFTVAYSQLSSRRLQVAGTPTFYDLVYWVPMAAFSARSCLQRLVQEVWQSSSSKRSKRALECPLLATQQGAAGRHRAESVPRRSTGSLVKVERRRKSATTRPQARQLHLDAP